MKLDLNTAMKQQQKLIMTQNMQQSIKLLQMSLNDLREYISNEYSENPTLEISDESSDTDISSNKENEVDYKELTREFYEDYRDKTEKIYSKEEKVSPLNFIVESKSLKEFLIEQLTGINNEEYFINICKYIIESLDERGYLEISLEDIVKELNISLEDGERALEIVQDLEPFGIGARNIKECLIIQSRKLNIFDEKMEKIITEYLESVAKNKYEFIGKKLNISPREAQRYIDAIKKLEPKPSSGFYTGEEVNYIIPDAEVKNINGEFFIIMNESVLPKLIISKVYKEVLQKEERSETYDYVKNKVNQAILLIKSVEERKNTLHRVLESLIKRQEKFFKNGYEYMKPLTLKEIADDLKMHESTISRAVKDKYVLTSFGTVKIKDLFPSGTNKSNSNMTTNLVKNEIKKIIEDEDKRKPLSDQAISDILKTREIKISRRTVAKYREELLIKSSGDRRRLS